MSRIDRKARKPPDRILTGMKRIASKTIVKKTAIFWATASGDSVFEPAPTQESASPFLANTLSKSPVS
jgi:hypothetical protein